MASLWDKIFSTQQTKYNDSKQFSPNNLLTQIWADGVASPATYEVLIIPPAFNNSTTDGPTPLISGTGYARDNLRFKVENAEFPGRNVKTTDYVIANAPLQQIGYGFTYAPLNITVIVSEKLTEKVFFEQWQEQVSNASSKDNNRYLANYYDNYVGTVTISQFDREGNKVYSVRLNKAYPILVNPVTLAWSAGSEIMRLNVTLAFHTWERLEHNI